MKTASKFTAFAFFILSCFICPAQKLPGLEKFHRVVFIGDSITYLGAFADDIEAYVLTRDTNSTITFLNLGQSSETASGLSEPNHAGGKYTRPDIHTRLTAILEKTKPDLVIVDYGMNDGIYQPYDDSRAQPFEDGIRWVHETVLKSGAKIIHLTPSPFDPQPIQAKLSPDGAKGYTSPYTNYDDTLAHYSEWLVAQRTNGWDVVDIHTPMNQFLTAHRQTNPDYSLSRDGVHPNTVGGWLMAREILVHLGAPAEIASMDSVEPMVTAHPHGKEILETVTKKEHLLRDAWLTEAGHLRLGHPVGLPLMEAEKQAATLDEKIHGLLMPSTP